MSNELLKKLSTGKLPTQCWDTVEAILPYSRRTLLYGPPGTGKTFAAAQVLPDTPVYSITLTEDTPMSEVRGHFVPVGGDFKWMHGPAIRAWLEGGRLIINEINRSSPEVQSFLFAILDDIESAQLTLPTGDTVKPHEKFTCVATMNGVPQDLPEALADRFPVKLLVDRVNPNAIERISPVLRKLAKDTTDIKDERRRLSIRAWLALENLVNDGADPAIVGPAVFGDRWPDISSALKVIATPKPAAK